MNSISLTIGNTTITVPIKLSNQQAMAVIRRYAIVEGIDVENLSAPQVGRAALKKMMRGVRDASLDRQRMELTEARRAEDEALLAADNDLFDEDADA